MRVTFEFSTANLKERSIRSSAYNVATRIFSATVQVVTTLVLARLLTPEDFGVVAMVTPFMLFITLFGNWGLSQSTLQRKDLTPAQASSLFYLNIVLGLALALGLAACAPMLSGLYGRDEPQTVALFFALGVLVSSLGAQQHALLTRSLRFDLILVNEIAAALISSVLAVYMATEGAGYMALVIRHVAHTACSTTGAWLLSGWAPSRPEWSADVRAMLRFGGNATGFGLVNTLVRQSDNVLIGWRHGGAELGPYGVAYRLLLMPLQLITWPIGQVMIPVLSRLEDTPEKHADWYLKSLRLISLAAVPPLFVMGVCADDIVLFALGERWADAAPIVRFLAPIGGLQVAYASTGWLMMSMGRADRQFRWALYTAPLFLVSYALGLPWGAKGVAAAYAIATVLALAPGFAYAAHGSTIKLTAIFRALTPALIAGGAAALGAVLALSLLGSASPAFVRIACAELIAVAAILLMCHHLFGYERMLTETRNALASLTAKGAT